MPEVIVSVNRDPIVTEQPNVRYANTFLSDKYRDYAVKGEALMDKVSGELFLKRVTDGRAVSFNQNKRYIHDTVFELRIALANYDKFVYPHDSRDAVYLSQNYDLASINNAMSRSALTSNFVAEVAGDLTQITNKSMVFSLSHLSNGFFCKPMSRDCDKPLIEYYNQLYNNLFENYSGENQKFRDEQKKFVDDPSWKYHDAYLIYQVTVERFERENFAGMVKTYYPKSSIKINEEVCVFLDEALINEEFENTVDKITIQATSLDYYKMHFIRENISDIKSYMGEENAKLYDEAIAKYISLDGIVQISNLNVMYFVDSPNHVILCGNEFILAFLSMIEISYYMDKLKTFQETNPVILSTARPSDDRWGNSCIWAERLSEIDKYGVETVNQGTDTTFMLLQEYFGNPFITYHDLTDTNTNEDDFIIEMVEEEGV